jgi:D-alanyl-D-alanine carboxypeptidase
MTGMKFGAGILEVNDKLMLSWIMLGLTVGYGLGLFRRGSFYGHNGSLMSFTTSMYHSNERDCSVIIYFNSMLELQPDFLFSRFMDILYGKNF